MTDPQLTAVKNLLDAIARYDEDALSSLMALDATLIMPQHAVYKGPAGGAEMVKDLARIYVDWKPVPLRIASEGNIATVEWTCTITDFGGSQSRLDGCTVIDFQGSKIHRARFYFRPEDVRQ